jgi:iron complex transport system substrate-binding protein
MRIVSLIASATEITHALGLGSFQVGRSHECDYPQCVLDLPVCTRPSFAVDGSSAKIDNLVKDRLATAVSIYEVFDDVLAKLRPTHIITQTQCKVCAVSLEDVEQALAKSIHPRPKVIALEPNSLSDIWADIGRVAKGCDVTESGERLVRDLRGRMKRIDERSRAQPARPRVACIEWHEPLMAAGNWVPELVDMANGENLFGQAGVHSPWMTWPDLANADPDVIISMPCGFDLARTEAEMYWLTNNPVWPGLTDGNQYMNRPGPRVVESLRAIAEILHPATFEPTLKDLAWRPFPAI